MSQFYLSEYLLFSLSGSFSVSLNCVPAAILDDPMECSRGERLAITLAKESINRSSNRSTTGKLEVDIFELLRDSEYETGETSEFLYILYNFRGALSSFTFSVIYNLHTLYLKKCIIFVYILLNNFIYTFAFFIYIIFIYFNI